MKNPGATQVCCERMTHKKNVFSSLHQPSNKTCLFGICLQMKYLFLVFFCLNFIAVDAQPEDARGVRDNLGRTYGERDIERTADRTRAGNTASPIMKTTATSAAEFDAIIEANKRGPYTKTASTTLSNEEQFRNSVNKAEAEREAAFLYRADKAMGSSVLPKIDQNEFNRDVYFCERTNLKPENRTSAAKAFMAYIRDSASASFDTLRSRAWEARMFPKASLDCYEHLRQRFPAQWKKIEGDEFSVLTYVFGSFRSLVYPEMTAYPESTYELSTAEERAAYLSRFEKLAAFRSGVALKNAGYCRAHLNPYLLLAERSNASVEFRSKCYLNVLFTQYPHII